MSAAKEGLTAQDLKILESYAVADNRELYFNYLAQKQGNDGYGLLALGVVRNDNAPGATANSFADRQARADGAHYGESQWQAFGVELMQRDLALRKSALKKIAPSWRSTCRWKTYRRRMTTRLWPVVSILRPGHLTSCWKLRVPMGGARKPKLSGPCCWTTIGWAWTGWRKPAGWSSASTRT